MACVEGGQGRNADDATAVASADHALRGRLHGEEDAREIDIDLVLPVLQLHLEDGGDTTDAGVGDGDVEATKLRDAIVEGGLDLGLGGDVALDDGGAAAKLAHRRGRFVGAVDVDVGDADVGAVTGEPLGGASADAGTGTGNKRDPIVVRTHALPLVPFLDYCACALVGGC